MNKHVLCAMDRKNKTEEERRANSSAADAVATYAADAATAAAIAAEVVDTVAYAANTDDAAELEYWLNEYFEVSGENRQDYEKAIEEEKK